MPRPAHPGVSFRLPGMARMDIPTPEKYANCTCRIRHVVLAIWLAVFAAGMTAQSVLATEMTVAMSVSDASAPGMDMPDCCGCDTDAGTDMAACDLACTAPLVADLNGAVVTRPSLKPKHEPSFACDLRGRTGQPALTPRIFI